jgi:hypothetical protein
MTNEELVNNMMNYSQYGALSQAFVMQAIEHLADAVIKQEEALLKTESFVHMPSWIGVAKEIKQKLLNNR